MRGIAKSNKEEFIAKAKLVHGDRYNYEKVEYNGSKFKVSIQCFEHGVFEQRPNDHLNGNGCPKCAYVQKGEKLKTNVKSFIDKAMCVHGNKYSYEYAMYINALTKIKIFCPEHGIFEQFPNDHLKGHGCPKCVGLYKQTTEEFIAKAILVHGYKYNYDKVKYVNTMTKVDIVCFEHGLFKQKPNDHLSGYGCPKCGNNQISEKLKSNKDEFVIKSNMIHGDKYGYSKVKYINSTIKVIIECPIHGDFKQTPNVHLMGCGCPICNESKLERNVRKYLIDNNILFEYQKRFPWLGKLSLDFYLPELNIAVECQGEQHFKPIDFAGKGVEWAENSFFAIQTRDSKKKELCLKHGIKILYLLNNKKNCVMEDIFGYFISNVDGMIYTTDCIGCRVQDGFVEVLSNPDDNGDFEIVDTCTFYDSLIDLLNVLKK